MVANEVVYQNFPPYYYQPDTRMPFVNRNTTTTDTQLTEMGNMMGNNLAYQSFNNGMGKPPNNGLSGMKY
jgi:hypothetical protein